MAAIELAGVTKVYGRSRGILDVDLRVEEGEIFGYLGPNGAGKTTTIRLLLDFIRPTRGEVRVLGRPPVDHTLRREIGYLAGELDLYDRFTGQELITYFDNLRGGGSVPYAREIAQRLNLDLSRPVGKLSKGNKQKVGVVQALMHKPPLLVLDEPTSGLDPIVQEEFFDMLDEHRRAGGTVFLSSHVLSEVERIAGRVGIIRDGRIVVVASLAELRRNAVREFEVIFDEDVPAEEFASLPYLTDVRLHGRTLSCRVVGSIDPFIKAVARRRVGNFISRGADLEELFLAYYRGDQRAS
jgi:ABC-2 type transport system ATP-binding protein